LLEINLKNINKGFALDLIAKKLNINRNEMAMIGDSNNDLTAMKNVGLPIGVKTKSEYVKKAVKYYLPYKRNAVANAICKYILSLNKQIELIATDLDGTLLHNGDKIILPNVVKSIQKVVDEKKLKFVICTGRSIDDILVVVKNLKIKNLNNVFIIGANGAFIYDVYNQRYIDEKFVKILYAKQVIDLIKSFYDNKKFKGQVGFEIFNSYTVNEIKSNKPLKHFLLNREFVYSNFVKKHPGMMINN
jgi:hydroxymethylpyrimidine pyrophosphatase-like HAD family hydrolase